MFMFTCKLHVQLSLPMLVIPLCRPWFPLLLLFPAETTFFTLACLEEAAGVYLSSFQPVML